MKTYYIKYLSDDQKQILSKKVPLEQIIDYDILMVQSEDYFKVQKAMDMEQIRDILND